MIVKMISDVFQMTTDVYVISKLFLKIKTKYVCHNIINVYVKKILKIINAIHNTIYAFVDMVIVFLICIFVFAQMKIVYLKVNINVFVIKK